MISFWCDLEDWLPMQWQAREVTMPTAHMDYINPLFLIAFLSHEKQKTVHGNILRCIHS